MFLFCLCNSIVNFPKSEIGTSSTSVGGTTVESSRATTYGCADYAPHKDLTEREKGTKLPPQVYLPNAILEGAVTTWRTRPLSNPQGHWLEALGNSISWKTQPGPSLPNIGQNSPCSTLLWPELSLRNCHKVSKKCSKSKCSFHWGEDNTHSINDQVPIISVCKNVSVGILNCKHWRPTLTD